MSTPALPPSESGTPESSSLLQEILKANQEKSDTPLKGDDTKDEVPPKPPKKREPISLGVFLRFIGSLLFVSVIFFGSFLAYIAFNPDQAVFFVNTFNIDPKDIRDILKRLINISFGGVMTIVSIVWIISLFRAYWVPKELKRKKILASLSSALLGIIFIALFAFWGYLFRVVGATDYTNPNGTILIYDQSLYMNEKYRDIARLYDTTNLIGPIDIYFDIRSNAETLVEKSLFTIEGFRIDFDGAQCSNGSSIIEGSNPENEQTIACRFEQVKIYNITGEYQVKNRQGIVQSVPMKLPKIEMRGKINIKNQVNNRGQKITTLDATSIKKLGIVRWMYSNGNEVREESITEVVTPIPENICLKVFTEGGCDRIFLLQDTSTKQITGSINVIEGIGDRSNVRLTLSGVSINPNEIIDIEWLIDNQNIVCKGNNDYCDYRFISYGRKNIRSILTLANGNSYSFETEYMINEPINIIRGVKVTNAGGILLNESETFDSALRAYVIRNSVIPPETLSFDARDIIPGNPGYTVSNILWKISNGKSSEERRGERISIDFNEPLRYTIEIIYSLKKNIPGEKDIVESAKETIIIDVERRKLIPRLDIQTTSDYVPTIVSVDASQSRSEDGEIKKFIFDFGEGRPPAEGDSIQEYAYNTAGEKTITLTIIAENGEKTSLKKIIVLKDQVRNVDFIPSINPGIVGNVIDFELIDTNGQIEEYIWNFGDNTPVSREMNTSHTYMQPGIYTVELTVIYSDGTRQSKKKEYEIISPQ